jgi:two-component system sensor histidine kinase SenX3
VAIAARKVPGSKQDIVEISVTDQGTGISEKDRERIFERFYRVDPARSRATGGTGLGLSIVKHVAASHGGTVSVWSVEGQGSTFTLRLPLAHSEEQPCSETADADGTGTDSHPAVATDADATPAQPVPSHLPAPEALP